MTNNIIINTTNRTITITKAFQKKARVFDSVEYNQLLRAKTENASYKVVVSSGKKSEFKGLNYEFMADYLTHKNDNEGLIYLRENWKKYSSVENTFTCASYGEMKKWFLIRFPELDNGKTKEREEEKKHSEESLLRIQNEFSSLPLKNTTCTETESNKSVA